MGHDRAANFIRFLDEFQRLRGRIGAAFSSVAVEGLSELETVVLNAVAGAAHPPTVPQIGRSLGHVRQMIQRAANSLIDRGLIETVPNPDHKRAHRLILTEMGRTAKEAADSRGLEKAGSITSGLDPQVIEDGRAALHAIREALEDHLRQGRG